MISESQIAVEIWSDYVCPFCYLELPAVQELKSEFGPRLDAIWHAFELRPDPAPTLDPKSEYLHDVWERSVYPMAQERDITLRLPPVQPRSRKAFEAAFHAESKGRFDEMHAALFRAFFEYGQDIGELDVLLDIGTSVGIDVSSLKEALENGRFTEKVLKDERHASELGIGGVPFILVRHTDRPLAEALVLRGAVPYESLYSAVVQAAEWEG
jgi:predicted DsbA family dithiol-disulfide isomerase